MANVFDQLDAPASVNVFDRLDARRANIFDQQDLKVAPKEEEPLVPQDYGPDWAKQFLEPGEVMSDADQARLHTPSISAPESGILPTLGRAKEALLRATSPITGPTDAQKIEESVPVKDAEGNTTYEYKPLANEIEKRGLIPALTAAGSAMVDLPSVIQLTGQGKRTTLTDIDEQRQKQLLQPDQNDSVAMQAWKAIHNSVLTASHAVVNPVFTLIPNSRILSGAFTVDMAKSALDQATAAENAATPQEKLQGYVGALISAGFGIGAGTHALKGDGTLSTLGKEDSSKLVQNAPTEALKAALLDPKLSSSLHPEVRGQIAAELNDRQQKQTAAEGAAKLEQELQPALLRFPGDVQERIGKIIAKQGNNEPLTPNEQATLIQIRGYASSIAGEQTAAEFTAPIEPSATAAEVRKSPQPDRTPPAVASTTAETTQSPHVQGGRSKLFAQALEEAAPEAAKAVEETTPEPAPMEKESEQQVKGDYETAHKKALDMADSISEQVAKGQSDTVKEAARDAAHKSAVTSIEKDTNNPQFNPDFMRKAAMEAAGKSKSREMQSLDTEEGATQHESVASEDLSPAQQVQQKEATQHVEDSLSKLSDREQEIINRTVKGDETLKSVAQDLGISHQRVQQIQAEALGKLKRAMQSRFGEDYTGGPGAMGPLEAAAMEGGKTTTSLKRAVVDAQRTVDGRDAIGIEDRAGSKQLISDAEDAMEKAESEGRNLGSEIIDRILNSKSDDVAVSRNDAAALLVERTRLRNARSDAEARIADKNSTEEERTQASSQFAQMDEQIDRADQASRKAGTAWSDFGRMYQQVLRDDYTVEAMKSRMVAARGGKELSAEKEAQENAKIKESYEVLKEKAKAYDDHLEKTRFDEAKAHFDKMVKDTFAEAKQSAKQGKSITDFLNDQADKARQRIHDRLKQASAGVDPTVVYDAAIIGASKIANGIKDFAKWSKAMIDDLGDWVKPHLKDLFDSSTQYHEANEKLFLKGKKPETVDEIKATVKKGESLSQKAVYDLARAHVKAGVEGMENVMKAVTKDLQEAHPGITDREVRDAFTGYGKVAFPSKEADLTKLREYRRLGQLQSAIEDAMAKTAPKKSGMQRDQPTQAIREKMKELNEAMRANGIETTSPEQQLKTANDARATSLRNQIADLDKRLQTGVKPGKKTPVPDSPEVESLRAQRDVMKEKLAEIEHPKKTADELAADAAQKAVDRAATALDRQQRINSGEITPEALEKAQPLSALEKELRNRTEALRQAKKKADSYKSPEQIAAEAAQKGVDSAAAALDRWDRILKGEIARDIKSPTEAKSALEEELRSQVDAMKRAADEIRRNQRPAKDKEAAREKAQLESLDKAIAEYERRVKANDFSTAGKRHGPDTEAVAKAKDARNAAKKVFDELKKLSPDGEEAILRRYKTALENRTKDIQDRLARNDYSKPVRNKVQLDAEAQKLKTDYDREKLKFDQGVEKERLNNRTKSQKFWDSFIGIERGMKLSSDVVLGKLTSAAVLREFALAPAYEATGGLVSKVLPRLAARAPVEGGFLFKALVKAKADFFTQGMKDAWKNLKMEHSDLEASNSTRRDLAPPAWYEYMGFLHSALKAPVKRSAFTHAMEKQIAFGIKNKEDINNPEVVQKYSQRAYLEANKAVFQQDNVISSGFSALLNQAKNSKKAPNLGPTFARIGNFLAPVVRVPTNIVGEVATGIHGPYIGAARAGYAYLKGIDSLPHEQADAIMSQLKRGLVGNALLLTGYFGYKSIGGFYQRDDKRPASDVQPETYKVGSVTLPRFTGHSQAGVLLDVGATLHRVQDKKGLASGARAATQGVVSQLPLIPVVANAAEAWGSDQALSKYINGMITSTVVPGLSSHIAKVIDTPGSFPRNAFDKANPRQPKTALDAVKVGIPGLRQQVPRPKPHRR